jgi:legumain
MLKSSLFISLTLLLLSQQIKADNYAILAAGSDGYDNYRHQADLCHAYHVLIEKGFNPENIIVLMSDDVAESSENPFKGKLFNRPSGKNPGVDVYKGCKIDYKGKDVTPEVFKAVLRGDADFVMNRGNGKVLMSG